MSKLEELRARLTQDQTKKTFGNNDKANYRFWDIPDGEASTVRFLPNGAESSDGFFWVEKLMIKLPFAGISGKNTNQVIVNVPCVAMYGETCPIQEEIKPLWKTDEDTARIYYKKKSFILHGFVRKNAVKDDETPENPVRRFNINGKLMKNIQAGLMDPEMEDMPTDFVKGSDFHIYKTKQGQWADYSTSKWARKSSSLTEEEALVLFENQEAASLLKDIIEISNTNSNDSAVKKELDAAKNTLSEYKTALPDLSTYLPKKPDEQTLAVIMEMFVDSMNGESYDLEKYGKFYKPYGLDEDGETKATTGSGLHTTVSKKSEEPAEETTSDEVEETPVATTVKKSAVKTEVSSQKQNLDVLLQQLKNKQAKK